MHPSPGKYTRIHVCTSYLGTNFRRPSYSQVLAARPRCSRCAPGRFPWLLLLSLCFRAEPSRERQGSQIKRALPTHRPPAPGAPSDCSCKPIARPPSPGRSPTALNGRGPMRCAKGRTMGLSHPICTVLQAHALFFSSGSPSWRHMAYISTRRADPKGVEGTGKVDRPALARDLKKNEDRKKQQLRRSWNLPLT